MAGSRLWVVGLFFVVGILIALALQQLHVDYDLQSRLSSLVRLLNSQRANPAGVNPEPAMFSSDGSVLPAPRPGLLTVSLPQLDSVEASVVRQMHESSRSFNNLVARGDVSDTDLANAYGALGQLYHAYGFLNAAENCYRNATRLAPGDFRWLHLLGYMSHQGGRLQDAVSFYSAALKSHPDDFPVLIYLGEVFLRLNRQAEAKQQFNAALPKYPAAALNGLGEAALLERRFEQAVQHFEAALHRVPQASRLHYSLAMAYRGLGRLEQAQFHLRQVGPASIQPADPVVDALPNFLVGERANLIQGQLAYQGGQFKTAAAAFAKALHAAPMSISASVNLGLALAKLGDTEGAIQQLRAALQLDSQNITALLTLGRLLAYQGRHAEAVDHFRAVIKHDPNHVEANSELRDSLLKLKTQSRPQSGSLFPHSRQILSHEVVWNRRMLLLTSGRDPLPTIGQDRVFDGKHQSESS